MWAALLPALGALLSRLVVSRAGQWVLSVLLFFGLSWGSSHYVMTGLFSQIQGYFGGLSASGLAWAGYLNLDRAVSMIVSAITVRASLTAGKLALTRRASP